MLRRMFSLLVAIVFSTVSFLSAEGEPDPITGIEGIVTVSPTRGGPIRKGSEVSNEAPLRNGAFNVANDKGQVASFTTDNDGKFRIVLAPGHYKASLGERRFPRPCGPFEIEVVAGKMTKVEWRCDTGMR